MASTDLYEQCDLLCACSACQPNPYNMKAETTKSFSSNDMSSECGPHKTVTARFLPQFEPFRGVTLLPGEKGGFDARSFFPAGFLTSPQIAGLNCLALNHKLPDSGERQHTWRNQNICFYSLDAYHKLPIPASASMSQGPERGDLILLDRIRACQATSTVLG